MSRFRPRTSPSARCSHLHGPRHRYRPRRRPDSSARYADHARQDRRACIRRHPAAWIFGSVRVSGIRNAERVGAPAGWC